MKVGIEVEGALRGVFTLFCQAEEFKVDSSLIGNQLKKQGCSHLYISDHKGILDDDDVHAIHALLGVTATIEVLTIPNIIRYSSIHYMLAVPVDPVGLGLFTGLTRHGDQVKFTHDRYVATALISAFDRTTPEEFEQDREL